jgi:hypothetical protein
MVLVTHDSPYVPGGAPVPGWGAVEAARAAADHARATRRLPGCPVTRRRGPRLEREQVELALEDVEQFLAGAMDVCADVKARRHDDLERRRQGGVAAGHLERGLKAAACDKPAGARRQHEPVRHGR